MCLKQTCQILLCHRESPSFYRFLKLSRFVEFSSRYLLLSLLNQSLIWKSFYPLYKTYSFDVLGGCARSRYTTQRFTTHQFTIHAKIKSFHKHTRVGGVAFIASKTSIWIGLNSIFLRQKADKITRNLFLVVHILFHRQSNRICLEN